MQKLTSKLFIFAFFSISEVFPRFERWDGPIPPPTYNYSNADGISRISFEWDPATEPWLKFHVRICGTFCNESQHVRTAGNNIAICSPACYPCDCDVSCAIYGTCCPSLDPKTPLAPKDVIVHTYSEDKVDIFFMGDLNEYDFVDRNVYITFLKEHPDMSINPSYEGQFTCLPTAWVHAGVIYHYTIAQCPPGTKNDTLRKLCETRDNRDVTADVATPISDTRNGIVFKNRYCLRCNEFNSSEYNAFVSDSNTTEVAAMPTSSYQKWQVGIECKYYQHYYHLESVDAFLKAVLKEATHTDARQCQVWYKPPESRAPPRSCEEKWTAGRSGAKVHPTSECILDSGVFRDIDRLCHSIKSEAYRISRRQNVFCYMCKDDFPSCASPRGEISVYVTSHFSFLLGETSAIKYASPVDGHGKDSFLCENPMEWMDETDHCQKPQCSEGKRLTTVPGTCQSTVKVIKNLGYKLTAILKPDKDLPENSHLLHDFAVTDFLLNSNTSGYLDVCEVVYGIPNSVYEDYIQYFLINGSIVSESDNARDDFEEKFLQYPFQLRNSYNPSLAINLSLVLLGEDMKTSLTFPFGLGQNDPLSRRGTLLSRIPIRRRTMSPKSTNWQRRAVLKRVNYRREEIYQEKAYDMPYSNKRARRYKGYGKGGSFSRSQRYTRSKSIWDFEHLFIDVTHSLVCPHVTFEIKHINSSLKHAEILVEFDYRKKRHVIDVASPNYTNSVSIIDRKVKICISTFRKKYQNVRDYITDKATFTISLTERAKRYFAFVCFIFSVVCLSMTITTYALLPQLRTLPGLNTLMLSISLAIAHIFLVVVVETVGYIKGWVCMGLGLGLHYSWLLASQWMAVCCYHMFSVFRGTGTPSSPTESKRKFDWYCFYAFGSSAVIVALTVIISEIISDGESTGYSPETCTFDTKWTYLVALLSFVLPIALISLSNLIMFVLTVKEIVDVTRLQAAGRMKGKDGVVTYVKLSSLTGLFWLLVILAVRLNNIILDFISIPFMALQGVFIFFSFTCNANTRKLYSQYVGRSNKAEAVTSTSTKVTVVDKDQNDETAPKPV